MNKQQLEHTIKPLIDGLQMRSETDSPFEFFYFENTEKLPLNNEAVALLAGKTTGESITTETLDHFFRNMVRLYPEDGEDRKQEAARFQELLHKLKELLPDVQVYRAGDISITVYILGTTAQGDFAGLKTLIVET